jgi:hypothetical protein
MSAAKFSNLDENFNLGPINFAGMGLKNLN